MRKRKFRRLLKLTRAARRVQRGENPFGNVDLCAALESVDPGVPTTALRWTGSFVPMARACVRQRLISVTVSQHLLPELMLAIANPHTAAPVTAPAAWREELKLRGIRLGPRSLLRWWLHLGLLYLQGLWVAARRAWHSRFHRQWFEASQRIEQLEQSITWWPTDNQRRSRSPVRFEETDGVET